MKVHEVPTLLNRISGYDGRNFAPAAGEAWFQILGAFPLDDCLRAVDEHYAINGDRVMPADVRSRCFTLRDLRAAAEQRALPAPTAPVLTARGKAAKAEVFRLIRKVGERSDAAMRPPMRADPSEPTTADSPITAEGRDRALRRLRHEGHR